jgi:hypothetical protein
MPTYSIFGGALNSAVTFDGLHECAPRPSTWTFRVDDAATVCGGAVEIGREQVSDDLTLCLARMACRKVVLSYSAYGLGDFIISEDGSEIVWRPGAGARHEYLRWVLLGRVMATAMYLGGTVCLHGSAVSVDGEGICFLAPKYHGKSTLAAAMVAAGARLVTDDVLPLALGADVRLRPGVPTLRLWQDSEAAVAIEEKEDGRDDDEKARIDLKPRALISGPEPLRAVYVLNPALHAPACAPAVTRTRLQGPSAFETLIRNGSIAPLLSAREARPLLEVAGTIVRQVPVYSLRPVRDLARLPEVVEQLFAWHGGVASRVGDERYALVAG